MFVDFGFYIYVTKIYYHFIWQKSTIMYVYLYIIIFILYIYDNELCMW